MFSIKTCLHSEDRNVFRKKCLIHKHSFYSVTIYLTFFMHTCNRPFSQFACVITSKTDPGRRHTSLKTRHNRELRWDCVGFQRDEPCTNQKSTSYIFTVFIWYLIHFMKLRYVWNISLPQVWNEIIAVHNNLGKLGRVKVHSWRSMEGGCIMHTHSSPLMSQLWEWYYRPYS